MKNTNEIIRHLLITLLPHRQAKCRLVTIWDNEDEGSLTVPEALELMDTDLPTLVTIRWTALQVTEDRNDTDFDIRFIKSVLRQYVTAPK